MTGTETTIVRMDGDNYPLTVDVGTGVVSRPHHEYRAALRGDAWRLFIDLVGLAGSREVPVLIRACNRACGRKTLDDAARREAALVYAGMAKTDLTKLSDARLIALANRRYRRCERLMTRHGEGLAFGWDWPTCAALWPEEYAAFREAVDEGRRRGFHEKGAKR